VLHSAEHIGIYLLLKAITETEFSIVICIVLLFGLWFAVMVTLHLLNLYLKHNWRKRMPDWVAESPVL
jgi:hypothetical protein